MYTVQCGRQRHYGQTKLDEKLGPVFNLSYNSWSSAAPLRLLPQVINPGLKFPQYVRSIGAWDTVQTT